jgi:hypothetical protein
MISGGVPMARNKSKENQINEGIDYIPEQDAMEVLDFIGSLNMKSERETLDNLEQASTTSMDFWDNSIDDEVWNNV